MVKLMNSNKETIRILKNAAWLGTNEEREKIEEAVNDACAVLEKQENIGRHGMYMIKLNNDYYAGPNHKYPDMHNISGTGPLGAKKMTLEKAEELKASYEKGGWNVTIEEYDPAAELKKCLEVIYECDRSRDSGVDVGPRIRNNAQHAELYLRDLLENTVSIVGRALYEPRKDERMKNK